MEHEARIPVRIPPEVRKNMEEMKSRDGLSLNTIVVLALKVYFHMNHPTKSIGE